MADPVRSDDQAETEREDLGPDGEIVQARLEQRFPDLSAAVVSKVIAEAAKMTAGAKIQSFRPLLVEHRATNRLMEMRAS